MSAMTRRQPGTTGDTSGAASAAAGGALPAKIGRKRDANRDADILQATLEVLAEAGYAGMTMDMVAARAQAGKATVYRRWASKPDLVIDAVAHMKRGMVDRDNLPDTGTLRGDLIALIKPQSLADEERRLRIMSSLSAVVTQEPALAGAIDAAVHAPWVEAYEVFFDRAIARGEITAPAHFAELTHIVPSMAAYRVIMQLQPVTREYLINLIDGVLLPALCCPPAMAGPAGAG